MVSRKGQVKRLQGRQVVLREKQIDDAGKDYAWATDRKLMHLDAAEPCRTAFSSFLVSYPEGLYNPEKIQFAIETLTGEHIGNCVCYNIDEAHREAELGIMIGERQYWGKGYGLDAVKTLMHYIFADLGIQRIFLHTLEWNIRAQECFERCGFTPCGRIMRSGQEFIKMEAIAPDVATQTG